MAIRLCRRGRKKYFSFIVLQTIIGQYQHAPELAPCSNPVLPAALQVCVLDDGGHHRLRGVPHCVLHGLEQVPRDRRREQLVTAGFGSGFVCVHLLHSLLYIQDSVRTSRTRSSKY